jgi:Fe-S-cluster containining protein
MAAEIRHFRCTECGACCNRSPEVGLSEAAGLADVFIFRLMFRIYRMPRHLSDYSKAENDPQMAKAYFEKKQLLSQFAARKNSVTARNARKSVEYTQYLILSALPMDIPIGGCGALLNKHCSIYDRRPLSCRTVPFQYSRPEALAERDFDAFVARPSYHCETGSGAEIVLKNGKIVQSDFLRGRTSAIELAGMDCVWNNAILYRMKHNRGSSMALPKLKDIEANAPLGAMTTSMRVAWNIAADAGLLSDAEYQELVSNQLSIIERELNEARCMPDDRRLLAQMRTEYLHCLGQ